MLSRPFEPGPELTAALTRAQGNAGAYATLSGQYRSAAGTGTVFLSAAEKQAYLAARFPATFASISVALSHLLDAYQGSDWTSLLDAGCGPATASFAASGHLPGLQTIVLADADPSWFSIATDLANACGNGAIAGANAVAGPLTLMRAQADLVVAAYVLNESAAPEQSTILDNLWNAAAQAILIVEPGTPHGFATIRRVRDHLIARGAVIACPCPHQGPCPLQDPDWCHFSVRLNRSAAHRRAKGAKLAYEDEKFSFVAALRNPLDLKSYSARIIKRPVKHRGHVRLDLCTEGGAGPRIIARSQGPLYRQSRDAEWGDIWPPHP